MHPKQTIAFSMVDVFWNERNYLASDSFALTMAIFVYSYIIHFECDHIVTEGCNLLMCAFQNKYSDQFLSFYRNHED